MRVRADPGLLAESVGLVVLLLAVPIAVLGLVLPVNEYSWMASQGRDSP